MKLGYLAKYTPYQNLLLSEIHVRRCKGWMYKEISTHLSTLGYRSTRGKELSAKLVERMYKKSLGKKEREETTHTALENIQVVLN